MIKRWGVMQEGKLLTVWGYQWQAKLSAIENKGIVIHWMQKVGRP